MTPNAPLVNGAEHRLACSFCGKVWPTNAQRASHESAAHRLNHKGKKITEMGYPEPTRRQLERVATHVVESIPDEDFYPSMLYRGSMPVSRVRTVYNYFRAAMELDMKTTAEMTTRSSGRLHSSPLAHLTGLHSYVTQKPTWDTWGTRFLAHPELLEKTSHLREYLEYLRREGGLRERKLTPIERWSPYANRNGINAWRYKAAERAPQIIVPQRWPYISYETPEETDGLDILRLVDEVVPKTIPQQVREDLCQDLVVAILMGEQAIENIQDALPQFTRKAFKMNPSKYGGVSMEMEVAEGLTVGGLIQGTVSAVGLCNRCENARDDLKDGVCGSCWEAMERELRNLQRSVPGEYSKREYAKPCKDVVFTKDDLDGDRDWERAFFKQEGETVERGRMRKKEEEGFIVGPRDARDQRGTHGLKRLRDRPGQHDYYYKTASIAKRGFKHVMKGDEIGAADEFWSVNDLLLSASHS